MLESKNTRKEKKIKHYDLHEEDNVRSNKSTWLHVLFNHRKKKSNGHLKCNCTYLSFPNMGESPIITDAKADLTCWLGSITKSYNKQC